MRNLSSNFLRGIFCALICLILFADASHARQGGAVPNTNLTTGQGPQSSGAMSLPAPKPMIMNGIRLSDYAGFQDNWKLVTVRYRTDTGEQRFTYANPIAFETLQKGGIDYPDGAVFAKIGVMTQEDPDFISSKVPSGARRIQFMVRNKNLYASTQGWGYALFAPDGHRKENTDEKSDAEACAACHEVVKQRGYVFSQLMNLTSAAPPARFPQATSVPPAYSFSDRKVAELNGQISSLLPATMTSVRFMEGTLQQHAFTGTADEVTPALIQEAIRSGMPAVFAFGDPPKYSLVRVANSDDKLPYAECPSGQLRYVSFFKRDYGRPPVKRSFCDRAK